MNKMNKENSVRVVSTTTRFNERWFVLGDIRNSTRFFHALDKTTNNIIPGNNDLLFNITHELNSAIESIYRQIEKIRPETASLGNTMGDGFLVVGLAGHGSFYIQYEFTDALLMCYKVKSEADNMLGKISDMISKVIKDKGISLDFSLPDLKLKLCIHFGYVLTSVGFNRYIGDCINYCARVISSAFEDRPTDSLVLTDEYFKLLPKDIQEYAQCSKLSEQIELENYFLKCEENQATIWRIPFGDKNFWNMVRGYDKYYDPSKDIEKLKKDLYEKKD